ncbi:Glycine/D-amino acid oxidase [Roseovarius nanhaiticus]|uniref:Glycine/D-amino acid oxidase n=1 Tax=Roseovarius nanhaiticus TaxID=573024 RepID=A0A1N7G904_9RHOB|nr:FAD-dependent oxidoreductase [Roseovarius nanhaiticus]SEK33823.1 Glycine/D-amino acid oxidase [Roseovarius nanhaiticus]SIS09052.1 Glycine/D-amino acid oxidase [Roseovarius nanhaiticus]
MDRNAPDINLPDITVIGGGVVGLSVALGLLLDGRRVQVLDGADGDARASQGNFGLVWGQGKGWDYPPYARWTADALAAWPDFAQRLQDASGIDVALDQCGGFEFFTSEEELRAFTGMLTQQQTHLGNRFAYDTLSGDDLRRDMPGIGPDVVGATYSDADGHVNPLRLLRALRRAVLAAGGRISAGAHVTGVAAQPGGGFEIAVSGAAPVRVDRVVLCAGLGTAPLAADLGFATRVAPQRGELLITEKLADRLPFLSSTIRQADEGGLQIGGTKADAGHDDSETLDVMAGLAAHAVAVLPALADLRVIRSWGALRVMSPDGFPVYARSATCPGAFLVTCHSGITLAPLHAAVLPGWIEGRSDAPELEAFDERRFALSSAA